MPPADLRRRLLRSPRLPQAIGLLLSLQLVVAAGALAGPWAVPVPAPAAVPVAQVADEPVPAAPRPDAGPVVLSAPGLWDGAVAAAPLGLDAAGALEVPATAGALGWWGDGPRPGGPGAAVVVGHVDLNGELGVFGRLADARPGALITVAYDGRSVPFRVVRVDRYAKDAFPTDVVYRPSPGSELRLVTCGGRFDPRTGHYGDNIVVSAVRA